MDSNSFCDALPFSISTKIRSVFIFHYTRHFILQVSQMVEMNLPSLSSTYTEYSNSFICHQFSIDDLDKEYSALFYVAMSREGFVNSVIYCFDVNFYDEEIYSTFNNFSYVHQAAFLTELPIRFRQTDHACVRLVYHHGIFVITFTKSLY